MSVLDDNSQKTPAALALQRVAAGRAGDATQALGKGLPCTIAEVVGPGIVVVNFEVSSAPFTLPKVMMPVCHFSSIKCPLNVGDPGVALSASTRLGAQSGLGSGVPSMQDQPGNLSCMTFFPLGTTSEAYRDSQAVDVEGNVLISATALAFFGASKVNQQTVSGALSAVTDTNAKAVLTSLIQALAQYGLIVNGTS